MLEKHLFSSLSRDICFVTSWQWRQLLWKTHNGAAIVNTDTAHPLIIMCFHQKDCNFQRDNTNRQGEGGEKHIKRAHSNFNQWRRPWGWLTKWRKKQLHCWRGMSICSHHDTTRERLWRLYSRVVRWTCFVPTKCHLCKSRWTCPSQHCTYCGTEYTSKWSQHTQSLWERNVVTTGQAPRSITWGVFLYCKGIRFRIVMLEWNLITCVISLS